MTGLPLAIIDRKPFFLKALAQGIQTGLIGEEKINSIHNDAAKCIVQIARYFGSEYLRPDLEKSLTRMVNMVSIYLESTSGCDLEMAAKTLNEKSLMFCSKGGSNILKEMIALELENFSEAHKPELDKWTLASDEDVKLETVKRDFERNKQRFAQWICKDLRGRFQEISDDGFAPESIIRSHLLLSACKKISFQKWIEFSSSIENLRQINKSLAKTQLDNVSNYPVEYESVAVIIKNEVALDLLIILDKRFSIHKTFRCNDSFFGRYYWIES